MPWSRLQLRHRTLRTSRSPYQHYRIPWLWSGECGTLLQDQPNTAPTEPQQRTEQNSLGRRLRQTTFLPWGTTQHQCKCNLQVLIIDTQVYFKEKVAQKGNLFYCIILTSPPLFP